MLISDKSTIPNKDNQNKLQRTNPEKELLKSIEAHPASIVADLPPQKTVDMYFWNHFVVDMGSFIAFFVREQDLFKALSALTNTEDSKEKEQAVTNFFNTIQEVTKPFKGKVLSEDEKNQLKQNLIEKLDANKDGEVNSQDVVEVFKNTGPKPLSDETTSNKDNSPESIIQGFLDEQIYFDNGGMKAPQKYSYNQLFAALAEVNGKEIIPGNRTVASLFAELKKNIKGDYNKILDKDGDGKFTIKDIEKVYSETNPIYKQGAPKVKSDTTT